MRYLAPAEEATEASDVDVNTCQAGQDPARGQRLTLDLCCRRQSAFADGFGPIDRGLLVELRTRRCPLCEQARYLRVDRRGFVDIVSDSLENGDQLGRDLGVPCGVRGLLLGEPEAMEFVGELRYLVVRSHDSTRFALDWPWQLSAQ